MLNFIHVKNDLNRCIIFVCACAVADWPHGTRLTNYHCVTFTLKIMPFLYQMFTGFLTHVSVQSCPFKL